MSTPSTTTHVIRFAYDRNNMSLQKSKDMDPGKKFFDKKCSGNEKAFLVLLDPKLKREISESVSGVLNYFVLASFNLFDPLFHLMDRTHYLLPGTEPPVTPMKDVKGIRHKLGAKTIFLKALVIMTISNMTLLLMTISFLHTNYSKSYKITLV